MPLWLLLAAALAARPARAGVPPAAQAQSAGSLSDLDRALLVQARYQVSPQGAVRTPAPESRLLDDDELWPILLKLRDAQGRKALEELEALQDQYLQLGKLTPEQRLKGQVALARNWDLLPPQARDGFNVLLKEAGGKPVGGLDLGWVQSVTSQWDKAVAGTLPEAVAGPRTAAPVLPTTAMRPPPPAEVARRIARVDAATWRDPDTGQLKPYSEDVRRCLREVMRYAAPDDSASVLRVLEKRHPVITRDDADMFANADGVAHVPSWGDTGADAVYRLALPDSYVFAPPPKGSKQGIKVPFVEAHFYKDTGVPPPPLDPYIGVKPSRVTHDADGAFEDFPDGSWRFSPTPESQAEVLLHEILHLDTGSEGGGAHALTNEMRSYYAQERLHYNRDEARGRTKDPRYGDDNPDYPWLKRPLQYRAKLMGVYMSPAVGEVQTDRVLIAQQLADNERALAATGAEFQRLRQAELDRRLDAQAKSHRAVFDQMEQDNLLTHDQAQAGRDAVDAMVAKMRQSDEYKNWDYRLALQEEHQRLLYDQALALQIVGEDIQYHRARGVPYAGGVK